MEGVNSVLIVSISLILLVELLYLIMSSFSSKKEKRQESMAELMSNEESALEEAAGLLDFGKREQESISQDRKFEEDILKLIGTEKQVEEDVKEKGAATAAKAVEEGAEASMHEEEAEEAFSAVEARSIGIEAALKDIVMSISKYSESKKQSLIPEEKESIVLTKIAARIKQLGQEEDIEAASSSHLTSFAKNLAAAFKMDMDIERAKEQHMQELIIHLQKSINVMKSDTSNAEIELKKIMKEEYTAVDDFYKELRIFEKSLKIKSKQVEKMGRNKEINPAFTVSVIKSMEERLGELKNSKELARQLKVTYGLMNKESNEMKKLLRDVMREEGKIKRFEAALEKRKDALIGRIDSISKEAEKLSELAGKLGSFDSHRASIMLTQALNDYFSNYIKILENDIKFNSQVEEVASTSITITQKLFAFHRLANELARNEENVENSIELTLGYIKGIVDERSKNNIDAIVQSLRGTVKMMHDKESIDRFMDDVLKSIEFDVKSVKESIWNLVQSDKNLISKVKEEMDSNSAHIGSFIGIIAREKAGIDTGIKKAASDFAKKLSKTNKAAADSFKAVFYTDLFGKSA